VSRLVQVQGVDDGDIRVWELRDPAGDPLQLVEHEGGGPERHPWIMQLDTLGEEVKLSVEQVEELAAFLAAWAKRARAAEAAEDARDRRRRELEEERAERRARAEEERIAC